MTDRDGIFAGDDPFALARDWLETAGESELNDPNAIALATVDDKGRPDVRMVLLKAIEDGSFVFYTNFESRKSRHIEKSRHAAFVLHWKTIKRQIRVRGDVFRVDEDEADAYYASRAIQSRVGAWVSRQSRPLSSREALLNEVASATARLGDDPPRPPFWGGYRIVPFEMEFWADGAHRLHDRFRWSRPDVTSEWTLQRLYP